MVNLFFCCRIADYAMFESREQVEAILGSEELQTELAAHGVDAASVQYWFLDDVSAG